MIRFTNEAIEIDLWECLKYDPFRHAGKVRAYIPHPYNQHAYLPLTRTRQRHGWRTWFVCGFCGRRAGKLYVIMTNVACRHCHNLRYASQYRKDSFSRRGIVKDKIERLQKQKRRLSYGSGLTQFGRRYYALRQKQDTLNDDVREQLIRTSAKRTAQFTSL
jgi:hypothetical protein